jgi:ABC-type Mn2+/Zn2+ transport system ATPase subunit
LAEIVAELCLFWETGRARIKRLSGGKRKRKLVAYAPINKMWMIIGLGVREA